MTRIAELLDCDLSRPVEERVSVGNDDPDTVFAELTEYAATPCIRAGYERSLAAIVESPKASSAAFGVWISGRFGAGKSSFAKILGYVLARRNVRGVSAGSLFVQRLGSPQAAESLEVLCRALPYHVILFDAPPDLPAQTSAEQLAETIYRGVLRDLDYADDRDVAELEIELETRGALDAFRDLCRIELQDDWRRVRGSSRRFVRASTLLHRLDPGTWPSTDTWLNLVRTSVPSTVRLPELVTRCLDRCETRRPNQAVALVIDEMGQYVAEGGERLESLRAVVDQFGRESLARTKKRKMPAPAWIAITARDSLDAIGNAAGGAVAAELREAFRCEIALGPEEIRAAAASRVLRKTAAGETVLRRLFRENASLVKTARPDGRFGKTKFDEDEFVRFYPYPPPLFDIGVEADAGIRRHPNSRLDRTGGNRTVVRQCFDMLASGRTRLADQPAGVLVSLDRLYDLVEDSLPADKLKDILDIRRRFDDEDYPGMAERVAKALCLMEFAGPGLPRNTKNVASLLVQRVTEAWPEEAVATVLYRLKAAEFVRLTEDGWTLNDLDVLRRAARQLEWLGDAVGAINPRPPGLRNRLIQTAKRRIARALGWYSRPVQQFNASVTLALREIVSALDRISTNMIALDGREERSAAIERISMDVRALEGRLERLEHRIAAGADRSVSRPARVKTGYLIGLFGTGRRYLNDLLLEHIGERARYLRDCIAFHPGPTPMIYSGHVTMKHVSRAQESPAVMGRILQAIEAEFADSVFLYRHPLDSLLTNWIWWRTFLRSNRAISGISQLYRNNEDFCAHLEEHLAEFRAFAAGDPDCFGPQPGPRFLSFAEFVEETELHLGHATLALRLEDFAIDARKEFGKIAGILSIDGDWECRSFAEPKSKPFRHQVVQQNSAGFRKFVHDLDAETRRRIERIGYGQGC